MPHRLYSVGRAPKRSADRQNFPNSVAQRADSLGVMSFEIRRAAVVAAFSLLVLAAPCYADGGDAEAPHIVLVGRDDGLTAKDELKGFGATFDFAASGDVNDTQLKPPVDVPAIYRAASMNVTASKAAADAVAAQGAGQPQEDLGNSESSSSDGVRLLLF